MNKLNIKYSLIIGLGIIIFGVIARFFLLKFVGIPNFEIITALTLVSAVFLGRAWGIVVPLSIIAITDVFIGNGPVMVFTWSAFAIIGILGMTYKKYETRFVIASESPAGGECGNLVLIKKILGLLRRFASRNDSKRILGLAGVGIISSVFFFLYTNFGWWLVSGMYPHTLDGLIQCYIMGLPFFKNNLIGNLIFVPMASGAAILIGNLKTKSFKLSMKKFS
ncbi:MAG: hypothetical protein Q8N37_02235 [bacterium]|nr:hypothetical protein [bacterium]